MRHVSGEIKLGCAKGDGLLELELLYVVALSEPGEHECHGRKGVVDSLLVELDADKGYQLGLPAKVLVRQLE